MTTYNASFRGKPLAMYEGCGKVIQAVTAGVGEASLASLKDNIVTARRFVTW